MLRLNFQVLIGVQCLQARGDLVEIKEEYDEEKEKAWRGGSDLSVTYLRIL